MAWHGMAQNRIVHANAKYIPKKKQNKTQKIEVNYRQDDLEAIRLVFPDPNN